MRSCPVRSAWLSACCPILFHLGSTHCFGGKPVHSFWYRVSTSFASFSRISRPAREALERDCHGATKVQILPHTVANESVVNRKESQPRLLRISSADSFSSCFGCPLASAHPFYDQRAF